MPTKYYVGNYEFVMVCPSEDELKFELTEFYQNKEVWQVGVPYPIETAEGQEWAVRVMMLGTGNGPSNSMLQ